MDVFLVFKQIVILFLLMAVGYVGNKCKILTTEAQQWLSKLIINITCPALIIHSVTTCERLDSNLILLKIFATAVIYFILAKILARGIVKVVPMDKTRQREYESMLIYTNLGFMGIPVVNAILGQEAILYLSIFMAVFNISVFSYGMILLQPQTEKTKIQFSRMINPGTVSAVIAILLYLMNISLPDLLMAPISSLGNTTTPLAMLVIGASLANTPIREMFKEKDMILFTLLRLIAIPFLCLFLSGFVISNPLLRGVLVLCSAMPVASNVVMICNELHRDGDYIAKGIFFSTLFSLFSIPIISLFLK